MLVSTFPASIPFFNRRLQCDTSSSWVPRTAEFHCPSKSCLHACMLKMAAKLLAAGVVPKEWGALRQPRHHPGIRCHHIPMVNDPTPTSHPPPPLIVSLPPRRVHSLKPPTISDVLHSFPPFTRTADSACRLPEPAMSQCRVKTFPIGIYPPAILPFLISFVIIAVEDVGDISAAGEVPHPPVPLFCYHPDVLA